MTRLGRAWPALGVALYNNLVTFIPSHTIRLAVLRLFGARIGRDCSILRASTVLGIEHLVIGDAASIGNRVLLDARGGLTLGDCVVIASDTQFITADHDPDSDDFRAAFGPVVVEDHVWLASRSMVIKGVTIGRGAVVGACALVTKDVAPMTKVAGIPARPVGTRESGLDYRPVFRPLFY